MSWIIKARLDAGYSMQGDFVKALAENGLHKSQNAVSTWETGGRFPTGIVGSPEQLQAVADTLNMSPVEILQKSGHRIDVLALADQELPPAVQEFIVEALQCSSDDLEALVPKFTDVLRHVRTTSEHDPQTD